VYDDAIGKLREARSVLLEERDKGLNSRELSITLTEIDTAILWRQEDIRLKQPTIDKATIEEEKTIGKFRVVEHVLGTQETIPGSKIYSSYGEASDKWHELMSNRPKNDFGIEAEIGSDWYALA